MSTRVITISPDGIYMLRRVTPSGSVVDWAFDGRAGLRFPAETGEQVTLFWLGDRRAFEDAVRRYGPVNSAGFRARAARGQFRKIAVTASRIYIGRPATATPAFWLMPSVTPRVPLYGFGGYVGG